MFFLFRALFLGLSSNPHISDLHLDISGCEVHQPVTHLRYRPSLLTFSFCNTLVIHAQPFQIHPDQEVQGIYFFRQAPLLSGWEECSLFIQHCPVVLHKQQFEEMSWVMCFGRSMCWLVLLF